MSLSIKVTTKPSSTYIHPTETVVKTLYSTKQISNQLLNDLAYALKSIDSYGSVEIYVQDSVVTQITTRNIKKTNGFARKATSS